ncbi:Bacteriophage replication A protein (GPA) [Janthinobacterium sp. KBS0711]|uniref:replication endonuclease n=1 Tax=Janthinobacterium sp. KBS0711 TaxID=1649647 RepID=UPI000633FAD9|nr:replication endonuclease [Janthinobacterium sp. KBS0711]KKO65343.1 Bacteriophage replication A protein (GPA) [Janthinobacterium sp. KBS0711]TSD71177.1 replication endonuclease [Janthinobacterium sp. KBS0711]
MQSKQILLPDAQRHEAFLRSAQFAPELARIPFKWRNRVITAAMAKMAWSSWYKIYESIATSFVREFAEQYVPAGVDLSQSDADIVATAERAAAGVTKMLWMAVSDTHALQIMEDECTAYGIELPEFDALADTIARLVDARWWRRQLRKRVKRAFEAGNIRLGYVNYRGEPYASNDAVLSRLAQNRRNAAALAATLVQNENGQQFSIAELAEKTTANKAIRRGELMLRINGFEQIARECGDQGIFITWTCPSRFHAMQHSGKPNDKFDGSTPREANAYLGKMTSLCRSALARRGIGLYGFRIAEPHHDGCPHWHLLLFVRPTAKYKTAHLQDVAGRAIRIMKRYAWRVDRGEPGAFARRLDVKRIDWAKGSAAGYIAKYVAKNIDGVAEHKTKEGYVVTADTEGDVELTPSARVESWAACWGIRQFQQWGGAPVTVWRELRRIEESMLNEAPAAMRRAWDAVQKIDGEKRACWAEYLRAQGGALVPRKELVVTLAKDEKTVIGRYGETLRTTPYGVRCSDLIGVVFKSVRHTWTPVQATGGRGVAVGVAVPRTRVNNCTHPDRPAPATPPAAPAPDLPAEAKTALIAAWAAVNACPYPRLIVPDNPPHKGNGT